MKFNLNIQIRADTYDQIQSDLSAIKKALRRRKDTLGKTGDEIIDIDGYNYEVRICDLRHYQPKSMP